MMSSTFLQWTLCKNVKGEKGPRSGHANEGYKIMTYQWRTMNWNWSSEGVKAFRSYQWRKPSLALWFLQGNLLFRYYQMLPFLKGPFIKTWFQRYCAIDLVSFDFCLNTALKKLESLNVGCCKCVMDSDMKAISGIDHKA